VQREVGCSLWSHHSFNPCPLGFSPAVPSRQPQFAPNASFSEVNHISGKLLRLRRAAPHGQAKFSQRHRSWLLLYGKDKSMTRIVVANLLQMLMGRMQAHLLKGLL
jgi:hypothetical protein